MQHFFLSQMQYIVSMHKRYSSAISKLMEQKKKSVNFNITKKKRVRFASLITLLILWCFVLSYLRFSPIFPQGSLQTIFGNIGSSSINFMHKKDLCSGRYVYVHNLPSKFNTDILKNCKSLLRWPETDTCKSISNMGLGSLIENSNGVLQNESWFITHPNLLEVIFHNRMKQYKCLTDDSSLASLIYIPYYAGLDLGRYLWGFNSSVRNSGQVDLFNWIAGKPEWRKMWGKDHFLVVGRTSFDFRQRTSNDPEWGNNLMYNPQVENMTILSIESTVWIYRDFSIPYPTHFHPSNDNQVFEWQNKMRQKRRPYLFSFVGGARPQQKDSIRNEIIEQCVSSGDSCKWLECSYKYNCDDPIYVMKVLESSKFCLQPRGDTATRRSAFDSILAGCIPVFFSTGTAYDQYSWHLPKNYSEYSVYIPEYSIKNGTANIERILSMIRKKDINEMKENVINLIPSILYANPVSRLDTFEDAFDLTIKGVLERVSTKKQDKKN